MENKLTDNEIIKALECCGNFVDSTCKKCVYHETYNASCVVRLMRDALDLINRQKAEIERLNKAGEEAVSCFTRMESLYKIKCKELEVAKSEAYKEFAEKITEIFMRYAHLHSYAEQARKDCLESGDGYEIEMQSVWDVFSLKKYEMAEYEEMSRLQKNIETIEKERLLTELEKDFRLLLKEMVGEKDV